MAKVRKPKKIAWKDGNMLAHFPRLKLTKGSKSAYVHYPKLGKVIVYGHMVNAKQCRQFAKWLTKAAEYLEAQDE